jgi:3-hydroxybutyryl-CoA dehydrogenase
VREKLGIAGSGAIACGLACAAAPHGQVFLWARSEASARRAREATAKADGAVAVETGRDALEEATFVVEAITEDRQAKAALLAELGSRLGDGVVMATTTSSLPVGELARASGRPDRFLGLHVFNPVPKMRLVELAFTPQASDDTRRRAHALCEALDKTAVEVPDRPGFVVNRLLFPYLFSAVRLLEDSGLKPQAIDECMALGAGHPMGPLALLDFVGLDVAAAIGEALEVDVPTGVRELIEQGALGRKSGRGFYRYE